MLLRLLLLRKLHNQYVRHYFDGISTFFSVAKLVVEVIVGEFVLVPLGDKCRHKNSIIESCYGVVMALFNQGSSSCCSCLYVGGWQIYGLSYAVATAARDVQFVKYEGCDGLCVYPRNFPLI